VLKDGASAIYGTDAIGGVINFILRKDYQGAEVTAYGTRTEHGGGNSRRYTAAVGFATSPGQRFNVLATFDYEKTRPSRRASAHGSAVPRSGRTSASRARAATSFRPTSVRRPHAQRHGSAGMHSLGRLASSERGHRRGVATADFLSLRLLVGLDIYPPSERKGFFTRGAFQLNNDNQLFAEYHLSKNEITFASSETPVNDFTGNGPFSIPRSGRTIRRRLPCRAVRLCVPRAPCRLHGA